MLERVLARFGELALTPVVAHELEFYLIDQSRDDRGRPLPPRSPRTGQRETTPSVYGLEELDEYQAFLTALNEAASVQRVPISATSKEYAPGQFEANLRHQTNALLASDHADLPAPDRQGGRREPRLSGDLHGQALCGTLRLRPARALEPHRRARAATSSTTARKRAASCLRHAAGGLAALMAESMAVFAPSTNSYRRFAPDMFAPVNRRWGVNNRSAGIRIPVSPDAARRVEHRCAGADANPYLVLAAILAGVHHGLANKLDPGPIAVGNVSREPDRELPFSLEDALKRLETAPVLPLYFGAEAVALYRETKAEELARFRKIITAEEHEWYL